MGGTGSGEGGLGTKGRAERSGSFRNAHAPGKLHLFGLLGLLLALLFRLLVVLLGERNGTHHEAEADSDSSKLFHCVDLLNNLDEMSSGASIARAR